MKLTQSRLRQIIKEELSYALRESRYSRDDRYSYDDLGRAVGPAYGQEADPSEVVWGNDPDTGEVIFLDQAIARGLVEPPISADDLDDDFPF